MGGYKAAVIGVGRIGAEPSQRLKGVLPDGWLPLSHVEAILSTPGISLDALCDTDSERLNKYTTLYHVTGLYTDAVKMFDELKPEIISIATRTMGRTDLVKLAVEKGVKGIYCEKPIARSLQDAKEAIELCEKNNVCLLYGTTRRYMAIYREAKRIVDSGKLGELEEIVVEYGKEKLLWTHPHFTDLLVFFADTTDIEYMQGNCIVDSSSSDQIDEDPVIVNSLVKFKNNIYGSIKQTMGGNVRLNCTKGNLTIYYEGEYIGIKKVGDNPAFCNVEEKIKIDPSLSGTQVAFKEMVEVLKYSSKPPISGKEIYAGLEILFGIVSSSQQEGKKITPQEINKQLIITGKSGNFYA